VRYPGGRVSFAEHGEDLVIEGIFEALDSKTQTYVDIGAWDPIICNNTYLFYCKGGRGLSIEPNPAYFAKLKSVRPNDTVLNIGIGVTEPEGSRLLHPSWGR